jgi:Asp-tRNA(Asn)/Glu-tRNA(Gln) amidotransferase A subunit family amidase
VWERVEEPMREAVESAARELDQLGIRVVEVEPPQPCDELLLAQAAIMLFEAARVLAYERSQHREALSAGLRLLVDAGAHLDPSEYDRAQLLAEEGRRQLDGAFTEVDLLLTPAALGEPPRDLTQTGDPAANTLWTLLHAPCVTLPRFRGPRGLPLGMQLVGRRGCDAALLAHVRWIEAAWA